MVEKGASNFETLSGASLDTEVDTLVGGAGDWLGRTIDGRYRVLDRIGEGGMGTIYVAEHLTLGKRVALKTVHPQFAGDGAVAERFAREATATAKLDHPHVASAIDYGLLPEGGAYLVMQLVQGASLHDAMDRYGAIGWPRACAIAAQIADALSAAHGHGIVHRDLKPENVMLEPRDDGSELVKVLDFGIARVKRSGAAESFFPPVGTGTQRVAGRALTQVGVIVGTPGYMAPEQARGQPLDHRADLYALGVLLWEMIAGQPLFDDEEFPDILAAQLTAAVPPMEQTLRAQNIEEDIPPALQTLVDSLVSVNPKDRPENAAIVRDTLRDIGLEAMVAGDTRARTAMGRLTPTPGRVSLEQQAGAPSLDASHFEPKATSARWLRFIGLLVVVGALSVAAMFFARRYGILEADPELRQELLAEAREELNAEEMERQVGLLFDEPDKDRRRQAADWLLGLEPSSQGLESYVVAVAELELARGCRPIRAALERVEAIGDARALPALERMADTPRTCGRRNRSDCYACVRADLERSMATLQATGSPATVGPPDPAVPE